MQRNMQLRAVRLAGEGGALAHALSVRLAARGAAVAGVAAGPVDGAVVFAHVLAPESAALDASCRAIAATLGKGGCLLLTAAVTALVPVRGDTSAPAQAAIVSFGRLLALDLAPQRLRVNVLAVPPEDAVLRARMGTHAPRGLPDAEAVANAALFLLDPGNTYTTGHVLVADGGWSIGYARDF